jgi:hypothetical protein
MSSLLHLETVKSIPQALMQKRLIDAGAISRMTRSYPATTAVNDPSGNSCLSVVLPPVGHVDFEKSYLSGIFSFTGDSSTILCGSIHSCFRRVQILSSAGVTLVDIDNYNTLAYLLQDLTLTKDQQETSLGIMSLMHPDIRVKRDVQLGFAFQPLAALLRSSQHLPLHYLGGITINLFLAPAAEVFKSNVDVTYTITKCKYVTDIITYNEQTESLMRSAYQQDKLRFHFSSYRHLPFQSQSQVVDMKLDLMDNSINGLLIAMRKAPNLTNKLVNSFERTMGSLTDVQFTIGSNLIDRFNVTDCGAQILAEVEKLLDSSNANTISPAEWSTAYGDAKKFAIGLHLNTVDDPNVLGGYSGKGAIVVSIRHSASLAEPIHFSSFVLHDTTIICGASNGTSIVW